MTKEDMVLKLLGVSPASRSDLVLDTGWGIQETNAVIDKLVAEEKVVFVPQAGNTRKTAKTLCLPHVRAELMKRRTGVRHVS